MTTKTEITREREIMVGDVVQINPDLASSAGNIMFAGCFMVVEEIKTWGVMGYVAVPQDRKTWPGAAYYRAKWDDFKLVGAAWWTLQNSPVVGFDNKPPRLPHVDVPPKNLTPAQDAAVPPQI